MSIEEITKVLKKKYKISPQPAARCYIMPNGDFLALDDYNSHNSVQYYLIDQGVVKDSPELHEGGCPTLEDMGAIRCNLLSEGFIMLSQERPTQAQYDSLIKLLDEFLPRRSMWRFNQREIMLLTPHQKTDFKFFDAVNNTSDDIVRIIKNYYDFGRLTEGFDLQDTWDYHQVANNIVADFENLYTDDISYCEANIIDDWGVGCDIEVFAYDELGIDIAWLVVRVYGENEDKEDENPRTGICFRQIEVNEEYQGKGIAKRLVETCLDNINENSLVLVHMDFSGGFWYHMSQEFPRYNWDKSLHEDLDKNIIHKFKRELKPNEVLLYHQTNGEKLKKIFTDGYIKADVWAQEDIDQFRYGDFAIGFAVDKNKVHKANNTDRIVYQNIPNKDFIYIIGATSRTEKGKENFRKDFNLMEGINKYYRLEIEDEFGNRAGLFTGAFELIPTKETIEEYPEDFADLTDEERNKYFRFDELINELSKIKSPGVDTNFNGFKSSDIFAFTAGTYQDFQEIILEIKQILKELGFKLIIKEVEVDDADISYKDKDQIAFSKSQTSREINESFGNNKLSREEIEYTVKDRLGTSGYPVDGPSYIFPDGKFLLIWDAAEKLVGLGGQSKSGKAMHLDVDAWIDKNLDTWVKSYYFNDYCIRVNNGFEEYIVLPKEKPTEDQYNSLLAWLDEYYMSLKHDKVTVMDYYGSWANRVDYKLGDILPEEIIKRIKRYYATGSLYEQVETGMMTKDEIRNNLSIFWELGFHSSQDYESERAQNLVMQYKELVKAKLEYLKGPGKGRQTDIIYKSSADSYGIGKEQYIAETDDLVLYVFQEESDDEIFLRNFYDHLIDYLTMGMSNGVYFGMEDFSKEELQYIQNEARKTVRPLYRFENSCRVSNVGEIVDMYPMRSFTATKAGMNYIAKTFDFEDNRDNTLYKTQGNTLYYDIRGITQDSEEFSGEDEVFVWGKFKVVEISEITINKIPFKLVIIEQIDTNLNESLTEDNDYDWDSRTSYEYNTGAVNGDDIFDTTTLGGFSDLSQCIPGNKYYQYMIDEKNKKGEIKMLSPEEYYKICAAQFGTTPEELKRGRSTPPEYIKALERVITVKKKKFPMPFIDYTEKGSQEGLHRMMAAGNLFGWDHKFPVLVIDWADKARHEKEVDDDRRWELERNIDRALENALLYTYTSTEEFQSQLQEELNTEINGRYSSEPDVKFTLHLDNPKSSITVDDVTVEFDTNRIEVDPDRSYDDIDIPELDDIKDIDLDEKVLKNYLQK